MHFLERLLQHSQIVRSVVGILFKYFAVSLFPFDENALHVLISAVRSSSLNQILNLFTLASQHFDLVVVVVHDLSLVHLQLLIFFLLLCDGSLISFTLCSYRLL